jgi:Zn-dependent M28 family amino/carboxypeptidase
MHPKVVRTAFVSVLGLLVASLALAALPSPPLPASPRAWSRPLQAGGFEVNTTGRAITAGAVATHTLVVSATGGASDTVNLAARGGVWSVEVPAPVVLPTGGRATAVVTVTVPFTAPARAYDTTEVVATGAGTRVVRSVSLTTRTGGDFDGARYRGCRFDFTRDGAIDAADVAVVSGRRGARLGDPRYERLYDLDGSGRVDARDVDAVTRRSGRACRTLPVADTAALQAAITAEGLRTHLEAFQAAATATGGNRAVGSAGYVASVRYVEASLRGAGLRVARQTFPYPYYANLAPPIAVVVAPERRVLGVDDVLLLRFSGSGDITTTVQAVDVRVPPDPRADSTTSGCEAADFADFVAGRIALIQRGACAVGRKALFAQRAGAVGVIIFNEGQERRQAVFSGELDGPGVTVPVFSASYAVGAALVAALGGGDTVVVHLFARTESTYRDTENVIAELPGRRDDVVMLGAHLDSVPAGPGMNDDGSGSAAVLEIARQMAALGTTPTNTVRFAFWGAEEIGLMGSSHYVAHLTPTERRTVLLYLNLDMIGSPNWARFIYRGDETDARRRPEGSAEVEATFKHHFDTLGLPTVAEDLDGRSDHGAFTAAGVPAGGLFTGTGEAKTSAEAALFGGDVGRPHDPCYHLSCDTVSNIDWTVLAQMADAAADATLSYGLDGAFAYHYAGDLPTADEDVDGPPTLFMPLLSVDGL